jgi:hypothetical protein
MIPPPWVLAAIIRLGQTEGPFKEGERLRKPGATWTPSDKGFANGFIKAAGAIFSEGTPTFNRMEALCPELKIFRSQAAAATSAAIATQIATQIATSTPRKNDALPKIRGTKQLLEYRKSEYKGTTAMLDDDGEMTEHSHTLQICLLLWFCWPILPVMAADFTIPKIRLWLAKGIGLEFDQKLLAKVCNDIGLRRTKRGRPRNKT